MNAGEVIVRIPAFHEDTHFVNPGFSAAEIPFVDQVPPDIGKSREARHAVSIIALLINVAGARLAAEGIDAFVRDIEREDERDIQVVLARVRQHALGFAEVFHVKACYIIAGVLNIERTRGRPRFQTKLEVVVARNHRLLPAHSAGGTAAQCGANARDLQARETIDRFANYCLVLPAEQPVSSGAVVKEVLTRALPNQVRGMLLVHAHDSVSLSSPGGKRTKVIPFVAGAFVSD